MGTRRPSPHLAAAASAVAAAVALGACGSSSAPAAGGGTGAGTVITVTLTDYHIALDPASIAPGTHTLHIVDRGATTHSLAIGEPGGRQVALSHDIGPGQSATMVVTFGSGSYDLFCPVTGHRALGMDLPVAVGTTAAGASSPTTAAPASPAGGSNGY